MEMELSNLHAPGSLASSGVPNHSSVEGPKSHMQNYVFVFVFVLRGEGKAFVFMFW